MEDNTASAGSDISLAKTLVSELLKDKASERRFKLVKMCLIFVSVFFFMGLGAYSSMSDSKGSDSSVSKDYVAMVKLHSEIMPGGEGSASALNPSLVKAFKDEKAKGVVMLINSPGGTPVQASLVYERIKALKKEYPNKKFIVVGEDMVTSGAYMIAVAADKIYVNRSTIAGSIGVISQGFGFSGLMDKVGVERRVHTAGISKSRMDPFSAEKPEDVAKLKGVLGKIHSHFMDTVKEGRKGKLKGDDAKLFSGDFWTGEEALELGLVDGLSDLSTVLKQEFGTTATKDYSTKKPLWEALGAGALTEAKNHLPSFQIVSKPEGF